MSLSHIVPYPPHISSISLNTHHYDGALRERMMEIRDQLDNCKRISTSDKINACNQMMMSLNSILTAPARMCFCVIVNEMMRMKTLPPGTPSGNYDPTNDLDAGDLLYCCSHKIKNLDFCKILVGQLEDMTSGLCAQGRTHRLFQCLVSFEDENNDEDKEESSSLSLSSSSSSSLSSPLS